MPEPAVAPIVQQPFVAKVTASDPTVISPTAKGGETLTVMNYVGNVRSKPSTKGDVLFTVSKGDVATRLDTKWG